MRYLCCIGQEFAASDVVHVLLQLQWRQSALSQQLLYQAHQPADKPARCQKS